MYITEFADVGKTGGVVPVGAIPANAKQFITFSATAGQSAAFANNTRLVRIAVDGAASIAFGTNPTAVTAQDARLSTGAVEYYDISAVMGQGYKVSAVTTV
jgi:hypothetical protein